MANLSDYLENALINHVLRNTPYSSPAAVYCAICNTTATSAQLEAGTLTNEITGYTGNRPQITFGAPSQVSDKATCKNTAALEFPGMPSTTVRFAAIMDSATKSAGNVLWWMQLSADKPVPSGETFRFPVDNLIADLA